MQKTVQIDVSKSIKAELEKMPRWQLMMYLQGKGESPVYGIAKDLGWSTGKAHAIIKGLERTKAVTSRTRLVNGRAVKLVKLKE